MKLNCGLVLGYLALASCACSGQDVAQESIAVDSEPITALWQGCLSQFGITGASPVVVSRGSGLLDLFAIVPNAQGTQRVVFSRYNGNWQSPIDLPVPSGESFFHVAVVKNGNRLDLIASTVSHKLFHTFSSTGTGALTFNPWTRVTGAGTNVGFGANGRTLAMTSFSGGRIDAWWLTNAGNIGHGFGFNAINAIETGDTTSLTYLRPVFPPASSIEAHSWADGRIDLVLVGANTNTGTLGHHFYDVNDGDWGSGSNVHRVGKQMFAQLSGNQVFKPASLGLLSSGVGSLEVYGSDPVVSGNKVFHASFSNGFGWSGGTDVLFDSVSPGWGSSYVSDAVFWNDGSVSRHDVFGAAGCTVQLFY
jgi:hypothetical protein